MRRCYPSEQSYESVLEDEDDAYPGIEATEVVGHQRQAERWPLDISKGSSINWRLSALVDIFWWNDLLEQFREKTIL